MVNRPPPDHLESAAVTEVGTALLGAGVKGAARAAALRRTQEWKLPLEPRLEIVIDTDQEAAQAIAAGTGAETMDDWRDSLGDERVQLLVNAAPAALHVEPTIDAAQSGTNVLCEAPLGRDSAECQVLYRACEDAGILHMCGFPLRFLPPLRMARELLAEGALGEVWHVRGHYLRSVSAAEDDDAAGVAGRIGPEIVDICRYLFGEIDAISAIGRRFEGRHAHAALGAVAEFSSGAIGTFHIGRVSSDRDRFALAVAGSRGTIAFDAEELGVLRVDRNGQGLRTIAATAGEHESSRGRFPDDHVVTSRDAQALELAHLLTAIAERKQIGPVGATFLEGYYATKAWEALTVSAATQARVALR
jgi:predicted dehydrogenase